MQKCRRVKQSNFNAAYFWTQNNNNNNNNDDGHLSHPLSGEPGLGRLHYKLTTQMHTRTRTHTHSRHPHWHINTHFILINNEKKTNNLKSISRRQAIHHHCDPTWQNASYGAREHRKKNWFIALKLIDWWENKRISRQAWAYKNTAYCHLKAVL